MCGYGCWFLPEVLVCGSAALFVVAAFCVRLCLAYSISRLISLSESSLNFL